MVSLLRSDKHSHKHGSFLSASAIALLLSSCGSPESASNAPAAAQADSPITSQNVPHPQVDTPSPADFHNAATWVDVKNTKSWTDTVIAVVDTRLADLNKARDIEKFCPGYTRAPQRAKEICWLRLVGSITKFESSYNPKESFMERDGNLSVGLLSLSPGECKNAMDAEKLKDPVKNLFCGVNKMADLISRAEFIAEPNKNLGAAAYWSVLRTHYVDGEMNLGKQDQIVSLTRGFVAYQ